jgi:hypothetical protein
VCFLENLATKGQVGLIDLQDYVNNFFKQLRNLAELGFNTYVTPITITDIAQGAHPRINSAPGSHHFYTDIEDAFVDGLWADCHPKTSSVIKYYPAASDNLITSDLTEIEIASNCTNPCAPGYPYTIPIVNDCSLKEELFGLIDIFDLDEGLWEERTNDILFSQDTPFREQRLLCSHGGGCQGVIISDKAPFAPWSGAWGLNPLEYIFGDFNDFNCDCNEHENCDDFSITECLYEYNPYLCEFYEIVMPGQFQYNGVWENNPHQDNNDLVVAFRFSALDVPANADVT